MKTSQNLLCICKDLQVIGYEYEKLVALGFPTHFLLKSKFWTILRTFWTKLRTKWQISDLLSSFYGYPIIFLIVYEILYVSAIKGMIHTVKV